MLPVSDLDTNLILALEKWGAEYELNVVQEECAEIIQVISKLKRAGLVPKNRLVNEVPFMVNKILDSDYRTKLIDEIADGYVVLRYLELIYSCTDEVNNRERQKLIRLLQRINTPGHNGL